MEVEAARHKRFLDSVLNGKRGIRSQHDAKLLVTAICAQEDHIQCIASICSKNDGFTAVRKALCMDLSTSWLNGGAAQFISYFTVEELRQLSGGRMLCDLLTAVMNPPLLLGAYKTALQLHQLEDTGISAFASLVIELLALLSPISDVALQSDIKRAAQDIVESRQLHVSTSDDVRRLAYRLEETIRTSSLTDSQRTDATTTKPGGRHDNDFADFRQISIFPSKDELLSGEPPYLLTSDQVMTTASTRRTAVHLDNQFRLLREDMLAELREDLKNTLDSKSHRRRSMRLRTLQFAGIGCFAVAKPRSAATHALPASQLLRPATMAFRCFDDALRLPTDGPERKNFFKNNRSLLPHGSFGCLLINNEVCAFATVERDEDLLAQTPSIVQLRFQSSTGIQQALVAVKTRRPHEIDFVMVDTPYFAYEPVLRRLQCIPSLPLADIILGLKECDSVKQSPHGLEHLANVIKSLEGDDLKELIRCSESIRLDSAQTESVIAGLTQTVVQIQGPPGTGKSFIGAILTKLLLENVPDTPILVLCYTNHALDQFLEDLLDIGVSKQCILRLGSKSTARTEPMKLSEQRGGPTRLSPAEWSVSQHYKTDAEDLAELTTDKGADFSRWKQSQKEVLESLEFSERDSHFFDAFSVPEGDADMTLVGTDGKAIDSLYLFDRWLKGKDAGILQDSIEAEFAHIWKMNRAQRQHYNARWTADAISERAEILTGSVQDYDAQFSKWMSSRGSKIADLMKSKRIIGCTTTASAKYAAQLTSVRPGIVLVEEAGEVLESHILTALSPNIRQLIMIGDHLQLRPKVKNHALTIEAGDGYDLNCSLFERLIQAGHPHTTLQKQHRMRPQISALVRRLMYPKLEDSISVLSRPDLLGIQNNVVFINHSHLEVMDNQLKDRLDSTSSASHQNTFEAKMILKIVKYLAQQGYGTDQQVVLTPYLGQLRLIMNELKADHDPILSDLDSYDFVKAGLLDPASAASKKAPLRISTIDNFQGEQSDIVIVSLTRSNITGVIGFMNEAQRLNVLLSRARNGLIIIGNAETFKKSRSRTKVWEPFFRQLVDAGHFFGGLPIRCEQHPARTMVLGSPQEFDIYCPNGGCDKICGARLGCGKHRCPEKCHKLVDHSMQRCLEKVETQCQAKHRFRTECWQSSQPCPMCVRDENLQKRRQQNQDDYLMTLLAIEDKIAAQRSAAQDLEDQSTRAETLEQKREELAQAIRSTQMKSSMQKRAAEVSASSMQPETNVPEADQNTVGEKSEAQKEWMLMKHEGAQNSHIDAIMNMIGLEAVKQKVLEVKNKVDTALRQDIALNEERFNVLLLGNPGTGKTTVARHYAKCLAYMGIVSGSKVEDTTASKLMSGGVANYRKVIDQILNSGGGALFIDEAYQLVAAANSAGPQILDAIMDDAENLRGKVVFLLAGYRKEMEGLIGHNPGIKSRFPCEFRFEDYEDDELLGIFNQQIHRRFKGKMQLEDGADGLFARIVARRVGYARGRPGFGNARAMENMFSRITSRQSVRLTIARRQKKKSDDFMLTKEDMLGPEPSGTLQTSKAWSQLQSLIGLATVKQSVQALMQTVKHNYDRELQEKPVLQLNLNRVFLGSPGTGKTTVAKLYGQILADLGMLSNGEVIVKNPSDFISDVIGGSEKLTKGILSAAAGKVLVIDEAYGLSNSAAKESQTDIFRIAVIDTLVAEVQSVPGEDRCILLLGYQEQMENMLRHANPGLARRFPISEAFVFEDFTDEELREVVKLKVGQQGYNATDDAMQCIMETLTRARNKLNFGNAGEVDVILNAAKQQHQQRLLRDKPSSDDTFEATDIDADFGRNDRQISIAELFEDSVGQESLIEKFQQMKNVVTSMKARGLDPRQQVPYNFVFCGPPGTGKTTTARKMGKIYHDLGILATDEVLERSVSEMIAPYVGQTGGKTRHLLESALGKVLLLDEAYRLTNGGFAKEALDELVDLLTKPQFSQKLIVILAGYDRDIELLMNTNPGLTSRFSEKITFESLSAVSCLTLLFKRLSEQTYLDTTAISSLASSGIVINALQTLIDIGTWANARDVENLAKVISRDVLKKGDSGTALIKITEEHVLSVIQEMTTDRERRAALITPHDPSLLLETQHTAQTGPVQLPQRMAPSRGTVTAGAAASTTTVTTTTADTIADAANVDGKADKDQPPSQDGSAVKQDIHRDIGVSDAVWAQLELDKQKAADEDNEYTKVVDELEVLDCMAEKSGDGESSSEEDETSAKLRELRLKREQEQIRLAKLRRHKQEMEEKRRQEQQAQQKLRKMGVCCMGFRWIKQESGYRCEGGSHFVSDAQINAFQ